MCTRKVGSFASNQAAQYKIARLLYGILGNSFVHWYFPFDFKTDADHSSPSSHILVSHISFFFSFLPNVLLHNFPRLEKSSTHRTFLRERRVYLDISFRVPHHQICVLISRKVQRVENARQPGTSASRHVTSLFIITTSLLSKLHDDQALLRISIENKSKRGGVTKPLNFKYTFATKSVAR